MKKCEKTELTISKILEAAMNEFGRNGYAGGTVNNICNAGINKGLIYHNFAGKDDIYLACLKQSSERLINYLEQQDRIENLESYLAARMDFFHNYPNEAHIFFEALLTSPHHLSDSVTPILSEFNILNEKIYNQALDSLTLRNGVSRNDALSYFHLMQVMLNGYFSSPVFQNTDLSEKIKKHEMIVPKLLDFMLYGIAKGEN
ncbi:MAG: TetR/AcrR family transcriptional regulator [Hespellia sp.]|nr:TetR/AcrR family transcriptional regulator [Hespellia sp.]